MFQGNVDQNSTVINQFKLPIVARFIRVHPVKFHGWVSLRMELYGCRLGKEFFFTLIGGKFTSLFLLLTPKQKRLLRKAKLKEKCRQTDTRNCLKRS